MSFREILYKWIVIADAMQHEELRDLLKGEGNCLIAYTYCDHSNGISAMPQYSAKAEKGGRISAMQPLSRRLFQPDWNAVIRYQDFSDYDLFILSKKQSLDLSLPAAPGFLADFFSEDYHENRSVYELDPFRVEGFPDDLWVSGNSGPEKCRIRLERVNKDTGEMVGIIISCPEDPGRAMQPVRMLYRLTDSGRPEIVFTQ